MNNLGSHLLGDIGGRGLYCVFGMVHFLFFIDGYDDSFEFMVRCHMSDLIHCWFHVLNSDVRVSAFDGLFPHLCFVLFLCALPGRSYWCAKHGFCSQAMCSHTSFIV